MHDAPWVPPIAARQAGAFTRSQAVDAGATRGQVQWWTRRGLWVPVVGPVLRSAAWAPDESTQAHAARLTWPDSVVALTTAARIHHLPVRDDGRIHVVVPSGRRHRGPLTPYQYRLDPGDVRTVGGVPVTTRERTILDCLGRLAVPDAQDLLAWVASRQMMSADRLREWLSRHAGRWGNRARAEAARRLERGAVNPAEDRLHSILRDAGIVGWIGGASLVEHLGIYAQADVYFPAVRLVLEADGRAAHDASRFQSDRSRQNQLVAAGCTVLRYTWRDLVDRPEYVATQVRTTLARLTASRS